MTRAEKAFCVFVIIVAGFFIWMGQAEAVVSSTTTQVVYAPSGSQTVFPYTFRILDDDDVKVYYLDSVGVETLVATGYTVSGVGESAGGNITFSTAPLSGTTLLFRRSTAKTQGVDLVPNARFNAETIETEFDKLTLLVQDQGNRSDRAYVVPANSSISNPTIPDGDTQVIGWNVGGTALTLYDVPVVVTVAEPETVYTATVSYYVTTDIDTVFSNGLLHSIVVYPYTAVGNEGRRIKIKNISSVYGCSVDPYASETIDGGSFYSLDNENNAIWIQSDGANWQILGTYGHNTVASLAFSYTISTDGYPSDSTILANAAANTVTVGLFSAVGQKGRDISVKAISATYTVTVDANAAETIDGDTTKILSLWESITLISDDVNWLIKSHFK